MCLYCDRGWRGLPDVVSHCLSKKYVDVQKLADIFCYYNVKIWNSISDTSLPVLYHPPPKAKGGDVSLVG